MANPDYSEAFDYADTRGRKGAGVSSMLGWLGAACSVALVAGLGWWVYDLAMRDVNGIPVIKALAGPAREAPADPGGFIAPNQGLAVNAVAAKTTDDPAADKIHLAPDATGLTASDQPVPELQLQQQAQPTPQVAATIPAAPPPPDVVDQSKVVVQASSGTDLRDAVNAALADAGIAVPASAAKPKDQRPQSRPAATAAPVVVASAAPLTASSAKAASPAKPVDVDPASLAQGTPLVQLGAYDSTDIARGAWDTAESRFQPFLQDKQRVIEKADVGGRTFYRLRVYGFQDMADARRFCAALKAEHADCIPVLVR